MSGSTFKKNRGKYSRNTKNKKELTGKKLEKAINKLKKPGKEYTPAQLMALKRKAQNKTISQVKAENEKSMRDKARARNATFKAAQKTKSTLKINKKDKNDKKKKNKKNNNEVYVPNLKFIK